MNRQDSQEQHDIAAERYADLMAENTRLFHTVMVLRAALRRHKHIEVFCVNRCPDNWRAALQE